MATPSPSPLSYNTPHMSSMTPFKLFAQPGQLVSAITTLTRQSACANITHTFTLLSFKVTLPVAVPIMEYLYGVCILLLRLHMQDRPPPLFLCLLFILLLFFFLLKHNVVMKLIMEDKVCLTPAGRLITCVHFNPRWWTAFQTSSPQYSELLQHGGVSSDAGSHARHGHGEAYPHSALRHRIVPGISGDVRWTQQVPLVFLDVLTHFRLPSLCYYVLSIATNFSWLKTFFYVHLY